MNPETRERLGQERIACGLPPDWIGDEAVLAKIATLVKASSRAEAA